MPLVSLLLAATVFARDPYEVTVENNVPMKARDGVTLRANVYRPKPEGKSPVLLERSPYDKDNDEGFDMRAAAHGVIYIIQDCRGRYASEGDWYTFRYESSDGYDAVEWARMLPYAN